MPSAISPTASAISPEATKTKLLPFEALSIHEGFSVVTYHNKTGPEDMVYYIQKLTARIMQVITANEWLTWRITKGKNGVYFEKPNAIEGSIIEISSLIVEEENDFIFQTDDYISICKAFKPHAVVTTEELIQNKGNVAAFVIFLSSDRTKLCLGISMSHSIADGFTLYTINNMISSDADIVSMNPIRPDQKQFSQNLRNNTYINTSLTSTWGMFTGILGCIMRGMFKNFFVPEPQAHMFKLNTSVINAIKKKHSSEELRISTNDVVTSWYFNISKVQDVVVPINMRNRTPDVTSNDAGNYLGLTSFTKRDYQTPASHRQFLKNCLAKQGEHKKFSAWRTMWKGDGLITNWAGFYKPVYIEGYEEQLHVPIFDWSNTKMMGVHLMDDDTCIIFKPRDGEIAMMSLNYTGLTKDDFEGHDIVECEMLTPVPSKAE